MLYLVNSEGAELKLGTYRFPSRANKRFKVKVNGVDADVAITGKEPKMYSYIMINNESRWVHGVLTEGAEYTTKEVKKPTPEAFKAQHAAQAAAAATAAPAAAAPAPAAAAPAPAAPAAPAAAPAKSRKAPGAK